MEQILAATDLSGSSIDAIERGFLIARATGARLTVLHAVDVSPLDRLRDLLGEETEVVGRKVLEDARAQLRDLVAELNPAEQDSVEIRVECGRAASVVPNFAAASKAELLLIGAHGQGFLHRILLGSTASILIRESRCPALVVKLPPRNPYKRVLVPVDFSPSSLSAIALAQAVSPNARFTLLHVTDAPVEGMMFYAGIAQERIDAYLREINLAAFDRLCQLAKAVGVQPTSSNCLVVRGDPTRQIVAHQEMLRSDLVVVGKHGTNVTRELLLGSVTNHLVSELQSDLLIVVDDRPPEDVL
jgi:nucleotide-binding universal stress UspA family protein